jgi:hypothetical protein
VLGDENYGIREVPSTIRENKHRASLETYSRVTKGTKGKEST